MKPTLTWLEGLSNQEVSPSASSLKRYKYVWLEQTDLVYANARDLIQKARI